MLPFVICHTQPRAKQAALPPISPASYLRLLRKAAVLSGAQVAAGIAPAMTDRANAITLIRLIESEGMKAKHRVTLDRLATVFPLDAYVYFQLCDALVDAHPRICRGCGCSHWDPCLAGDGAGTCAWASAATCTKCADAVSSAASVRQ